jgi:hypothetical protein
LETRQGFVRALSDRTLGRDLLREQFAWTWERLATILRKHLTSHASPSLLSYLAYFTAADALTALDRLGMALGMDLGRDGLIRLARLLSGGEAEPALDFSYALDPELRNLLGLGPPLEESGPAFEVQELELPAEIEGESISGNVWPLLNVALPSAYAAEAPSANMEGIKKWIPPEQDISLYLDRVKELLEHAASEALSEGSLDKEYHPLFRLLMLATGWQESCWKQFIKGGGKVRYLLSYNQSSVGLMQINERVWRGIYRPASLRWNIRYNARAGSEILGIYLQKYALKQMDPKKPPDTDTIARVVYAMYNGGPGELQKFFRRIRKNALYKNDQLFWEKYTLAKAGRFDEVSGCLLGGRP